MRALAILLALSACYPHDVHKRTLAKYAEGASIVTGIALEYAANSQADCDQMKVAGMADGNCGIKGAVIGDLGVGLMLAGRRIHRDCVNQRGRRAAACHHGPEAGGHAEGSRAPLI